MGTSSTDRRTCVAKLLAEPDQTLPDIVVFQEVESVDAIRLLNQRLNLGYDYSLVIDGNDPRNIDVGVLSRLPIGAIRTHINDPHPDPDDDGFLFSRDCLEFDVELPEGETLTVFLNHLKSKLVIKKSGESNASHHSRIAASHARRQLQAERVLELVRERFEGRITTALFMVVGDFNDTAESPYLSALFDYPYLYDIIAEHLPNPTERWTYWWKGRNRVSQIDHILVSQALRDRIAQLVASDSTRKPHIDRQGIGFRDFGTTGDRRPRQTRLVTYPDDQVTPLPAGMVSDPKIPFGNLAQYPDVASDPDAFASDHCPIRIWF